MHTLLMMSEKFKTAVHNSVFLKGNPDFSFSLRSCF